MVNYVLKKVVIAVLSSIALSLLLAYLNYTPESQRSSDVSYWSFRSLLLVYGVYALPVITIAGIPVSILIDKLILFKLTILNFIIRTIVYGIAGALLFGIFLLLIDFKDISSSYWGVFRALLIGVVGSVLFCWLDSVFRLIGVLVWKRGKRK